MSDPEHELPTPKRDEPGRDLAPTTQPSANEPSGSQSPASPPGTGAVSLRASDLDRRTAATILHDALGRGQLTLDEFDERTAAVWAAKYVSDLEPLTNDLVPAVGTPQAAQRAAAERHPTANERVTGGGDSAGAFAIWGGFDRKGVWTIPSRFTAVAVMGGGDVDLRYANLGSHEVVITAVAIMGGIDIVVPDDVIVRVKGIGIMGAFEDGRKWGGRPAQPASDAPVIIVQGAAIMGGISVVRKPSGPVDELEG